MEQDLEKQTTQDLQEYSFEEAMAQLEAITKQLSAGDLTLEQSLVLYEQGMTLSRHCQRLLDTAERQIQVLRQGPEGLEVQDLEEHTSSY